MDATTGLIEHGGRADAPPIVLLHGLMGRGRTWQRQVPWYARPFVRLRPDPALPIHPAPLDEVGGVKAPLLVVHGEADRVIPIRWPCRCDLQQRQRGNWGLAASG